MNPPFTQLSDLFEIGVRLGGAGMAKIEQVKDLPEWFNLSNYRGAEAFTANEWLEQLSERSAIFSALAKPVDSYILGVGHILRRLTYEDASRIRKAPLKTPIPGLLQSQAEMPVRAVRMQDLATQAQIDCSNFHFGLSKRNEMEKWAAIADQLFPKSYDCPLTLDHGDEGAPPNPVIQIEICASDAVLKAAFSIWLKNERKKHKAVSSPAYARWARYGLLPYLDLWMWALETEVIIPARVMSAAINDYDAGEANLRKTVMPLAAELMRDLSPLRALASFEAATRDARTSETLDG